MAFGPRGLKDRNTTILWSSPFQTFTVGPGMTPGLPLRGSRALTAGRELHPTPKTYMDSILQKIPQPPRHGNDPYATSSLKCCSSLPGSSAPKTADPATNQLAPAPKISWILPLPIPPSTSRALPSGNMSLACVILSRTSGMNSGPPDPGFTVITNSYSANFTATGN